MAAGHCNKLPHVCTAHMLHQNGTFLFTGAQPKINCQGLPTTASFVKILVLKWRASLALSIWSTQPALELLAFSVGTLYMWIPGILTSKHWSGLNLSGLHFLAKGYLEFRNWATLGRPDSLQLCNTHAHIVIPHTQPGQTPLVGTLQPRSPAQEKEFILQLQIFLMCFGSLKRLSQQRLHLCEGNAPVCP